MPHDFDFVTTADEIRENVRRFSHPSTADRDFAAEVVGETTYWVVDDDENGFGPTKFVGIKGMTFAGYGRLRAESRLRRVPGFSGGTTGETGKAIKKVLGAESQEASELRKRLSEWCIERFGQVTIKSPTQFVRLPAIGRTENKQSRPGETIEPTDYCIQYHNWTKYGLPWPRPRSRIFGDSKGGIVTGLSFVRNEIGSQVFLIVGLGKNPRRYLLWETFEIDEVKRDGDQFVARGPGWILNPPQALSGKEFDEFRLQCANFVGFKNVTRLLYAR